MKKSDIVGLVFNIVLGTLYIPFSIACWLLMMASESTIDATNPVYINLVNAFCTISFIIPLLCPPSIVLSVILRIKKHRVISFVVQFIPLILFGLNLLLLYLAELLPKTV